MKNDFNDIDKALEIKGTTIGKEIVKKAKKEIRTLEDQKDSDKDYEYTRDNLYALIKKGQEALDNILEIAQEGQHPRAFEVAGQLIKNVSDVTDKLIDLQHKMKELDKEVKGSPTNVTNALFVGSTAELQKLLKNGFNANQSSK
jgi:hypothetical protein